MQRDISSRLVLDVTESALIEGTTVTQSDGVIVGGPDVVIRNSTLSNNVAVGGSGGTAVGGNVPGGDGRGFGGAVFNLNGTVTVEHATFSDNFAEVGSDVLNLAFGTLDGVPAADATLTLSRSILNSAAGPNVS